MGSARDDTGAKPFYVYHTAGSAPNFSSAELDKAAGFRIVVVRWKGAFGKHGFRK